MEAASYSEAPLEKAKRVLCEDDPVTPTIMNYLGSSIFSKRET